MKMLLRKVLCQIDWQIKTNTVYILNEKHGSMANVKDIPDWNTAIAVARDIVLRSYALDAGGKTDSYVVTSMQKSDPETFQEAAKIIGKALELLLISKNEKYGKGNILTATKFGMQVEQGLMLRENDKTERILNHFKGINLGVEGLLESFGDKTGYSAIGMMLQLRNEDGRTWYELPIKYNTITNCEDCERNPQCRDCGLCENHCRCEVEKK